MGITRLNVYAGLAGMYIIRDEKENSLNIPKGDYEIPLMIMDRSFNEDGSLFYPKRPNNPSENLPNPSITPAFLGDTILVNGKVWPYLEVEPRKPRCRLLNASNTRAYQLYLDSGQSFH
jgi:spore coat protein A